MKFLKLAFCHTVKDKELIEACKTFPLLKRLHLVCCIRLTVYGVTEACKSCPLLEVLGVLNCNCMLTEVEIESIGQSCPDLKAFGFNGLVNYYAFFPDNRPAHAIAENMPGLRKLRINYAPIDDDGLLAILEGCSHLEFLSIRECDHITYGEKLKCRLEKIRVKCYNNLLRKYIDYGTPVPPSSFDD